MWARILAAFVVLLYTMTSTQKSSIDMVVFSFPTTKYMVYCFIIGLLEF